MSPLRPSNWGRAGHRRRLALLVLILTPAFFSAQLMHSMLPPQSLFGLNWLLVGLFLVLFSWISIGFWSSVAGLAVLLKRYNRFKVTLNLEDVRLGDDFRTALLFPVYKEDMLKVTEGIRATFRSLKEEGTDKHFDIFILSDSTDPDSWVAEEEAWYKLCQSENLFGRLFYRRRKSNLKRKSGNIADFCRRWGANYRYMIIFDADSLMSGQTLGKMVAAMETHPSIGILQTPPKVVLSRTLLARMDQFANHLYGPILAAGLHFWQLGDAQYWGHNAIIRVEPFTKHCQLPKLPGRAPLGGEILSHDFVESALMRRAGYGVWLAYELNSGSYEQRPPNLIDELVRDRRWCQGNLQHSRLIFAQGFFPTHRALFINGIMSYVSALLWLFFLLASSFQALSILFITPDYFPGGQLTLFPDWPRYFPTWALALLSGTAGLLFLPKILAIVLVSAKGGAESFGGVGRLSISVLAEIIISTFLAPVRMIFHSAFVLTTILGVKVGWTAQNRDDNRTTWREAISYHWWGTLFGFFWGALMFFFSPGFFLWLAPVTTGLVLSIPLSVWTSSVAQGRAARRLGLFISPPETNPPREMVAYQNGLRRNAPEDNMWQLKGEGFAKVMTNPRLLILHKALAANKRRFSAEQRERLSSLVEKALANGPDALSSREKLALLNAPQFLDELHHRIWCLEKKAAIKWGLF